MIEEINEKLYAWAEDFRGGGAYLGYGICVGEKICKGHDSDPSAESWEMEAIICNMESGDKGIVVAYYMSTTPTIGVDHIRRVTRLSRRSVYYQIDRIHRFIADKLHEKHAND